MVCGATHREFEDGSKTAALLEREAKPLADEAAGELAAFEIDLERARL